MHTSAPGYARCIALDQSVQVGATVLNRELSTLGRAGECWIVVTSPIVSQLNACVERYGLYYTLRDMRSANGTFVNGRRITGPHLLRDQDTIGLGHAAPLLRFLAPELSLNQTELLHYDAHEGCFFIGQQRLSLASKQIRLLTHLYEHANTICTYQSCTHVLGGEDNAEQAAGGTELDELVAAVRRRLRELDPYADCIVLRRGVGYELVL